MIDRPLPQENDTWIHQKRYRILGVSIEINVKSKDLEKWVVTKWATHTENDSPIAIFELVEGIVLFDGSQQLPNHVVYKAEDSKTDKTIWARPLENFMAKLGSTNTYYRFVRESQANQFLNAIYQH